MPWAFFLWSCPFLANFPRGNQEANSHFGGCKSRRHIQNVEEMSPQGKAKPSARCATPAKKNTTAKPAPPATWVCPPKMAQALLFGLRHKTGYRLHPHGVRTEKKTSGVPVNTKQMSVFNFWCPPFFSPSKPFFSTLPCFFNPSPFQFNPPPVFF